MTVFMGRSGTGVSQEHRHLDEHARREWGQEPWFERSCPRSVTAAGRPSSWVILVYHDARTPMLPLHYWHDLLELRHGAILSLNSGCTDALAPHPCQRRAAYPRTARPVRSPS